MSPNLPNLKDLTSLHRWAVVSLAARCTRRGLGLLEHLLVRGAVSEEEDVTINAVALDCVSLAEQCAESTRNAQPRLTYQERYAEERRAGVKFLPVKGCGSPNYLVCVSNLHYCVDEAATNAINAAAHPLPQAYEAAHKSLVLIAEMERDARWLLSRINDDRQLNIPNSIGEDFELLCQASRDERWTASTAVPREFFALRSDFSERGANQESQGAERSEILTLLPIINDELIAYISRNPNKLYTLSPRRFEELMAEVFDGFGFDVELTAQTRDGGYDIVAIERRLTKIKLLIECKRYGPSKSVGIAPVQRLHGVTQATNSTKGLLVTTAPQFTTPAQKFLDQHCWQLEGHSYNDVVEWLHLYQRFRMHLAFGVVTR